MTSALQRSYEGRAGRALQEKAHPLAEYLYRLMAIKQTNLCLSADVHSTTALLRLAEEVGDHICVLKTHADIIDDFGERTIKGLTEVAKRKRFLIFEDRKFGDIGNTVEQQYVRGPMQIAAWAHLVNAHIFPGPGIVTALRNGAKRAEQRLGRSVSTEIFVGTPEVSEEEGSEDEDEPGPLSAKDPKGILAQITTTTQTTSPRSEDDDEPPETPASVKARRLPMEPEKRRSVRATTTIYQTFDREDSGGKSPPPDGASVGSVSTRGKEADRQAALAQLGDPPPRRALLLFAQMSSAGNLMDDDYTAACVTTAREHRDFVIGFITQKTLNGTKDNFLSLTPGVNLPPPGKTDEERARGDGLGQQYRTPTEVIGRDGADIVIVGRGILSANNRKNEAERYQMEAWKAYEARLRA